jgi:hypothetical protein
MTPIELRRLDPACNMFRVYWLAIEPDLFGGRAESSPRAIGIRANSIRAPASL